MSDEGEAPGAVTVPDDDAFEIRLAEDEARLARDEQRIARDEERLARDEARLELEERAARVNRLMAWFSVGLAVALAVSVASLIVATIALRREVHTLANAAGDNSVATSAIQDSAVTASKLAPGAVTAGAVGSRVIARRALAPAAVGPTQLARNAVTGKTVRRNSLTGADIREGTLAPVPAAQTAHRALAARNSTALGGLSASAYLSRLQVVQSSTTTDTHSIKGPLSAQCPGGMRVISGAASVVGPEKGIALVKSTPNGRRGWTGLAVAYRRPLPPWRLVVTAICARGGR